MLIHDAGNFLGGLKRLHDTNEGIVFPNFDGTFNMMLRSDSECDVDYMTFEVLVIHNPEKDETGCFYHLLEREISEDDDEEFILGVFCVNIESTKDSEDLVRAMHKLNSYHSIQICPCNKYFIRDSKQICFYCEMTASIDGMKVEKCTICHEETPIIAMRPQPCCKQYMHIHCMDRWMNSEASGENPNCPVCRAPMEKISSDSI